MITVIFEIIFAMFKKLYRFFGPALFVLLVLVIEIIAVPIITDERAQRAAYRREPFEVLSLKEIAYDEEAMDRVFEIKLKNNSSEFKVLGGIAVTDRDGKDIHSSLRSEFEKLKVCGHSAIIDYVPPGSTYTAKLYIDDYKLEGIDSICIYDFYTSETDPKIFEITKK